MAEGSPSLPGKSGCEVHGRSRLATYQTATVSRIGTWTTTLRSTGARAQNSSGTTGFQPARFGQELARDNGRVDDPVSGGLVVMGQVRQIVDGTVLARKFADAGCCLDSVQSCLENAHTKSTRSSTVIPRRTS